MPEPEFPIDVQRVSFLAAPGSRDVYKEVAALEGLRVDVWIRSVLHAAAVEALEAHGRDASGVPPIHIQRPPRLQPRYADEPDGDPT